MAKYYEGQGRVIAEALVAFIASMLSSKWNKRGVYLRFHVVASAVAVFSKYVSSTPLDAMVGTFIGIFFTDLLLMPRGTGRAGWFDALYVTPLLAALLTFLAA